MHDNIQYYVFSIFYELINSMYLDLNCFSYESTFSFIYFFIITSLNYSVILFYLACFINCLIFSYKCRKSISFGIIDNLFVKLAIVSFSISFFLFLFFLDFLLLFFLDSLVLLVFLFLDSLVLLFFLFLVLLIFLFLLLFLLGLTFSYVEEKNCFYNNLHILRFKIAPVCLKYTTVGGNIS